MKYTLITGLVWLLTAGAWAQESPKEEDFYKITKVVSPEGTLLEVGGLATLPNGDLGIATRRGDIFVVENPTAPKPYFRKYASGLHEILGLAYKDGAFYCAQRGELTKITDANHDGQADTFETIYAWPISGHYHEYSFGPKIAPDGSFFVTGNVAFGDEEWWRGESRVPWRGWTMKITEDGHMQPWATGMRSPCGLGIIDGELFYADNQGDWMGSGGIVHLKKGAFVGHPAGLRWTGLPGSPLTLTADQIYAHVDERRLRDDDGRAIKPENRVNESYVSLYEMKKALPDAPIQTPAVWLPHGIQGISNSEILSIPAGSFGPFGSSPTNQQVLVGDQGQSKIMRVFLEKVNGEYQGASFDFRSGFRSGVLRMAWAKDGSLFVGETNRGWGSAGDANEGLQRLYWNNQLPFEMRAVRAMPDGFEVEFTAPVDRASAEDLTAYSVESFIYKYHAVYGSPPVNKEKNPVRGVKLSDDGLKARIIVDNLRPYYIHDIRLEGVRSKTGQYSLVHPTAYYTLNSIPDGQKLALKDVSTHRGDGRRGDGRRGDGPRRDGPRRDGAGSVPATATPLSTGKKPAAKPTGKADVAVKSATKTALAVLTGAPTYDEIKPLLSRHTCLACHQTNKKQVGPAYSDVAKRRYSNEQIVDLIYNPKPQHWPDYAVEMPPMPQVPRADALKIAAWINSLAAGSSTVDKPKP